MPTFTITANVTVDVEMEIEAATKEEAEALFRDHVIMTASLIDVPAEKFDVSEDSISNVENVKIRREAA